MKIDYPATLRWDYLPKKVGSEPITPSSNRSIIQNGLKRLAIRLKHC